MSAIPVWALRLFLSFNHCLFPVHDIHTWAGGLTIDMNATEGEDALHHLTVQDCLRTDGRRILCSVPPEVIFGLSDGAILRSDHLAQMPSL